MAKKAGAALMVCSYNLFHAPWFSRALGTTPAGERRADPNSDFLKKLDTGFRPFAAAVSYTPNQVFIGNLDPSRMPERPWYDVKERGSATGAFGDILDETVLYGLMKYADVFNLILLEQAFSSLAADNLASLPAMAGADLSSLEKGAESAEIDAAIAEGAFPLYAGDTLAGCVKAAHPSDENLSAHTMTENLASKATAVYAVRRLNLLRGTGGGDINYIIETSEEACGDMNQRGGGNFAKAIGELAGLTEATGSDTRSFCAGPVHGLIQAASLVSAGTFENVVVTAGGTTAKLAMNAKKHLAKGLPVLEDVMGSFAVLVGPADGQGLDIRTDAVGIHRIGSGAAPQAVIGDLVAAPLEKAGLAFADIDTYAPELHNPEVTEEAGAGNVTLQNMKMIAAMAVMKKQLERPAMNDFISAHGVSGWAPTQGHIPSGIPALGWFITWAKAGTFRRGMVIGKGSLFLGRMTNLFDGVSVILESGMPDTAQVRTAKTAETIAPAGAGADTVTLGFTVTGAEVPAEELQQAAEAYAKKAGNRAVKIYSSEDPGKNHAAMDKDLVDGIIDGALTFHYTFPVGTATTGLVYPPQGDTPLFIATTTGTTSTNRVNAMVLNALQGRAVARAWGIEDPAIGFLNLEGASEALRRIRRLASNHYSIRIAGSSRNADDLLRGNDILKGTCDVLVCDSLTGNALVKILAAGNTGGEVETTGAGYGCGLAHGKPVGIISRATSGSVAAAALEYLERMIRGGYAAALEAERSAAAEAGLDDLPGSVAIQKTTGTEEVEAAGPEKTPVDAEIDGIDVLTLEDAVRELLRNGIYCESGMGCTGPVVMVAKENKEKAKRILSDRAFL